MVIRGLALIGLPILIFVLCLTFLHFDFFSSGLWWMLFFLLGISQFVFAFGKLGRGTLSPTLTYLGWIVVFTVGILSFVFFWWQGGVAMIVAGFLWMMFLTPIVVLTFGRKIR